MKQNSRSTFSWSFTFNIFLSIVRRISWWTGLRSWWSCACTSWQLEAAAWCCCAVFSSQLSSTCSGGYQLTLHVIEWCSDENVESRVTKGRNALKGQILKCLKGQCHEIFNTFYQKNLHLGPIWTGKNGFTQFFVFTKILAKNMLPLSGWHNISVVIDYADTRLAQSLTMRTMSQNNSWLREHVNYFALEKVKSEKKVTKNVTLYFRKIVLILCWRSHWLHRHVLK